MFDEDCIIPITEKEIFISFISYIVESIVYWSACV